VLLAETQSDSYNDKLFEFGKTYVYWVRSVTLAGGNAIESDDSGPAIVTPRDTFPPAVPQNLAAAVLPGPDGGRLVDLSWSINLETDLAGYRVYRSEKEGEQGQSLQAELVVSPAFRDASVQPGKQYWYSVTAVDRAGNESAASEPALADLTQPLP
jgi:fibronectin type 3 domain-containing protein